MQVHCQRDTMFIVWPGVGIVLTSANFTIFVCMCGGYHTNLQLSSYTIKCSSCTHIHITCRQDIQQNDYLFIK